MQFVRLVPTTEAEEAYRKKRLLTALLALFAFIMLLIYNYKHVFTFFKTKIGCALLIILAVILIYVHIEPFYPKFTYNEIQINKTFNPVTIVQISDVHLQWPYIVVTESKLNKYIDKVNSLNPDFIFVTGDLISRYRTHKISSKNVGAIKRALSRLKAKIGIYAVLGNNDYCALQMMLDAFEELEKVHLLRNSSVRIGEISISGIDSCKSLERAKIKIESFSIEEAPLKIFLAHEPDIAQISYKYGFDIQFSGHTHGGQCVAPLGFGPVVLPTMGRKYPLGLYQIKNMLLYVTTGLGISPLPKPLVRFNNRPEIPIIRLVPKK